MESTQNSIYPPALVRALTILEHLANDLSSLSIKELSDKLSIPHSSAYRIVKCLQEYGYLREDPSQNEKYRLGFKTLFLSRMAFNGTNLISICAPYAKLLAEKTNQACQLCVLDDSHIITLDQSLPLQGITVIARIGEAIPVNVSASGKVLMSLLPKSKRQELLKKKWRQFRKNTEHTIIDVELFLEHLEEVSNQLYGTDIEEYSIGIGCISVPIFDNNKEAIAAIGLTGSIAYYRSPERMSEMLSELRRASGEISEQL